MPTRVRLEIISQSPSNIFICLFPSPKGIQNEPFHGQGLCINNIITLYNIYFLIYIFTYPQNPSLCSEVRRGGGRQRWWPWWWHPTPNPTTPTTSTPSPYKIPHHHHHHPPSKSYLHVRKTEDCSVSALQI
jgi:hypothetical protein